MSIKKIVLLGFFLCIIGWHSIKAIQLRDIEDAYNDLGYKTVPQAVHEAESFYRETLEIPEKLPSLDFTYSFGRFDRNNEVLEIEYLNEEKHKNYIINIMPIKKRASVFSFTDSELTLDDGTKAYYSSSGAVGKKIITFTFEKNSWIYMFSIDEALLDDPLEKMADIANSF